MVVNLIVLNILIALILESSQAVREDTGCRNSSKSQKILKPSGAPDPEPQELQGPIEEDLTLEDAQQMPGTHQGCALGRL